jgi:hypothetical protein
MKWWTTSLLLLLLAVAACGPRADLAEPRDRGVDVVVENQSWDIVTATLYCDGGRVTTFSQVPPFTSVRKAARLDGCREASFVVRPLAGRAYRTPAPLLSGTEARLRLVVANQEAHSHVVPW